MALVFVPAGPDDDSPERIFSRALYDVSDENDLLPFLPIQECPDFTISTVVDKMLARVLSGHPLCIGDFLVVRGKNYKIKDIYPDKHGAPGAQFMVKVWEKFANTTTERKINFRRVPKFSGWLKFIPAKDLFFS